MKISIKDILYKLQIEQLEHDESFHKEITRLNIHKRLNHMVLHFAKYSGKICDYVLNNHDDIAFKKIIIDSFIISVSCANILNLRISDQLPVNAIEQKSLFEISNEIVNLLKIDKQDDLWLVKIYPVIVGELAKAIESVDHLEPFTYREAMNSGVIKICMLMLVAAEKLNVDLTMEVPVRLSEVKKKSIFFDYYMRG